MTTSNHFPVQFTGPVFRPGRLPASDRELIHSQKLLVQIDYLWGEGLCTTEISAVLNTRGWSSLTEADVYNLLTAARSTRLALTPKREP
jgi:hypothetical protein